MRIIAILLIALFVSCKSDSTSNVAEPTQETSPKAVVKTVAKNTPSSSGVMTGKTDMTPEAKRALNTGEKIAAKSQASKTTAQPQKSAPKGGLDKDGIPNACDLVAKSTIAKLLNKKLEEIVMKDGTSKISKKQRSCFFKWDDREMPNAGLMVQVSQNPVADDVPTYFTFMVESLRTQGERDMTGSIMKFYPWKNHGDDASYSSEAGKYIWRVGNDWAFTIAFNTTMGEKAQLKAAEGIYKEMMAKMSF